MKKMWLTLIFASSYYMVIFAQVPASIPESGFSDQYKSENTFGESAFGYNEDHTSGGSFRRETSDRFGNKIGSYGLRISDGRVRIVNYIADQNGFRANVFSNEPGINSQDANPFSKITKKSIYEVLVPGFRYSSTAPHVSFENNEQFSNIRDRFIGKGYNRFNAKYKSFSKDGFTDADAEEDHTDDNLPTTSPNRNFDTVYPERKLEFNYLHTEGDEELTVPILDGEYGLQAESVIQNITLELQPKRNASDLLNGVQDEDLRFTSTVVSEIKSPLTENQELRNNTNHNFERDVAFEDSFQSTIVKTKERVAPPDGKHNATLHDASRNMKVTR